MRITLTDTPAIEIESLSKAYGKLVAVNWLDLRVYAKQVHGFLGPNSAGKTITLLG